jgi:hypothetical protein
MTQIANAAHTLTIAPEPIPSTLRELLHRFRESHPTGMSDEEVVTLAEWVESFAGEIVVYFDPAPAKAREKHPMDYDFGATKRFDFALGFLNALMRLVDGPREGSRLADMLSEVGDAPSRCETCGHPLPAQKGRITDYDS